MTEPASMHGKTVAGSATACPNCGAQSGAGRFCAACGQVLRPVRRGLASYAHEVFENILSADTKTLRSLVSLIARPGDLAQRAVSNRGADTINPVKLFFAVIVAYTLFFAVAPIKYAQIWVGTIEDLGWDASVLTEEDIAAGYDTAAYIQFFIEPRARVLEPALAERIGSGALAPDFWPMLTPLVTVIHPSTPACIARH